jgi:hypothetical protein
LGGTEACLREEGLGPKDEIRDEITSVCERAVTP